MGVIINCTHSHLDYFTRNLVVCKGDLVATAHGYVSSERIADTSLTDSEPIGLEEAKAHLEITESDQDEKVERWIKEARHTLERDTALALTYPQRWRVTIQQFPSYRQSLYLPVWPVQQIDSLVYFDRDNNEQSLDVSPGDYILSSAGRPAQLGLIDTASWPTSTRQFDPGRLELTAGWENPDDIPRDLIQALKKLIGDFAGFRESRVGVSLEASPKSYDELIAPWVLPAVG
jgi:uncharacterized phiE125 gp8 family phage protein